MSCHALPVTNVSARALKPVLKLLSSKSARLTCGQNSDGTSQWSLTRASDKKPQAVDEPVARTLLANDYLLEEPDGFRLSDTGRKTLKRLLSAGDGGFAAQHRDMAGVQIPKQGDGSSQPVRVNLQESPLAWLASRKTKRGTPFLTADEVTAGERLRKDYEFARLTPSFGPGWKLSDAPGGTGAIRGQAEFSDDVYAARDRVQKVLGSLEPMLSGVLVDVCCHLKGLAAVEAEREWPVRSGKIVLKIALASLSLAYGYKTRAPSTKR
ncbi:hypothetical protein JM93_00834 [Roseibium hamelinense]|uniref:DUF6456 domain-containing protein n=1 Tax=Roseibium hamelinense TaxID=150831 RepID=A0A562THW2_9HYPH|nr:DUF6456 domain-containing protein [Roseibium hamelinense]MTI42654.1 hypothetical protein [Roseibium hamelinense]TWI93279.1 hypothetical protein JM93_00834 [Roseibium hamelinense]